MGVVAKLLQQLRHRGIRINEVRIGVQLDDRGRTFFCHARQAVPILLQLFLASQVTNRQDPTGVSVCVQGGIGPFNRMRFVCGACERRLGCLYGVTIGKGLVNARHDVVLGCPRLLAQYFLERFR